MNTNRFPPRKDAIFTVLNDWFDMPQDAFERIWPELDAATRVSDEIAPEVPAKAPERKNYAVEELRRRIACLVEVLKENGGEMHMEELKVEAAKKAGIFTPDVYYVVNSAVADDLVTSSLRSGMVKLI